MGKKKISTVESILENGDRKEKRALFAFSLKKNSDEEILFKFDIWSKYFFPKMFQQEDAWFHKFIDEFNLKCYRGEIDSFTDIVFRGGAKSTRTKLFVAFCIANDLEHYRTYIKWLSKDSKNATQAVTDIYNFFVKPRFKAVYPSIFEKSDEKREETKSAFTTSFGVKVLAGTVGVDQRGHLQGEEASRPDLIIFDDFETRNSLRSAVEGQKIWDNMDEARTGLSPEPKKGACIYLCNYISERGNVHRLVLKGDKTRNIVLIVPIVNSDGSPNWYHTKEQLDNLKKDAEDWAGDYLCQPSAGADVVFSRDVLNKMPKATPIRETETTKTFRHYDPSHRYGLGADVSLGVGLDSSTACIIDFDIYPMRVVMTYKNNMIKPEVFGMQLAQFGEKYGDCIVAPENNAGGGGGTAIYSLKQQNYPNIYYTQDGDTKVDDSESKKKYGWNTNTATKPKMILKLQKAVDDGHLLLEDEDLIQEAKSYSRDDLMDRDEDVRLTTRHFDLLTACAIAFAMKDFATYTKIQTKEEADHIRELEARFDKFSPI